MFPLFSPNMFSSFVVGFGKNFPKQAHHASSSCPAKPAACDWNTFNANQPNAFMVEGALVGGPKAADDKYVDLRSGS
jgi:endoglucanase